MKYIKINVLVLLGSVHFQCRHAEKPKDTQAVTQKSYFCFVCFCFCQKLNSASSSHLKHPVARIKKKKEVKKPQHHVIISRLRTCKLHRHLDQTPRHSKSASSPLPIWCFFKQFIFVIISKRRRAAIKRVRYTLSAEGPSQPSHAAFLILFYLSWFLTNVSNSYR